MPIDEYVLVLGVYATPGDAAADLRDVTAPGHFGAAVGGAGILHRDWQRSVLHQGSGGTVAYGIGTGAAAGIVAGVFVGTPLIGALAGAAAGGLIGRRIGRREVDGMVALLDDAIPVGGTAVVAVVTEERMRDVQAAMTRALRTSARVLDDGPLTAHARAFVRGNPQVMEALDLQAGRTDGP